MSPSLLEIISFNKQLIINDGRLLKLHQCSGHCRELVILLNVEMGRWRVKLVILEP